MFKPLRGGVDFTRFKASTDIGTLSRRDNSRATIADWLKPRRHKRLRWSGTGMSNVSSSGEAISGAM
jgi:hypothetical protein